MGDWAPGRLGSDAWEIQNGWLLYGCPLRGARRELRAAGGTVRKRPVTTTVELTAQETQIARLAGEGLSNPQIATRLFLSPRTVRYHLEMVFTKLDITSRAQLSRASSGSSTPARRALVAGLPFPRISPAPLSRLVIAIDRTVLGEPGPRRGTDRSEHQPQGGAPAPAAALLPACRVPHARAGHAASVWSYAG